MAKESKINILLMSASSKSPLYEALSSYISNNYEIILADSDDNCLMAHLSENFIKIPYLKDLNIEQLCKICKEKNIQYIIPTRDGELEYFAQHKHYLNSQKINVMVSELDAIRNCVDKLKFYEILNSNNINAIKTTSDINKIETSRYVVKERFGSGSRNIGINLTFEEAKEHSKKLNEPIFQPYIEGDEYSVDVYNSKNNIVIGMVVRKRVVVRNGESQVTEIVVDKDISRCIEKAITTLNLCGHSVSQVIKDKDGKCHIIEINARVGGASTLSFKAGIDSINWFINECNGLDLKPVKTLENLKMIRIAKDLFYDSSI